MSKLEQPWIDKKINRTLGFIQLYEEWQINKRTISFRILYLQIFSFEKSTIIWRKGILSVDLFSMWKMPLYKKNTLMTSSDISLCFLALQILPTLFKCKMLPDFFTVGTVDCSLFETVSFLCFHNITRFWSFSSLPRFLFLRLYHLAIIA